MGMFLKKKNGLRGEPLGRSAEERTEEVGRSVLRERLGLLHGICLTADVLFDVHGVGAAITERPSHEPGDVALVVASELPGEFGGHRQLGRRARLGARAAVVRDELDGERRVIGRRLEIVAEPTHDRAHRPSFLV